MFHLRDATLDDHAAITAIRMTVTENVLTDPAKVTYADYVAYISDVGRGWVAEVNGAIVGFSFANRSGLIWALFIAPGFEGRGLGQALLACCIDWLRANGCARAFLDTGPNTRAERFYRRNGWRETARTPLSVDYELKL
jgi:GNAT superfamily N-acetyltransferase